MEVKKTLLLKAVLLVSLCLNTKQFYLAQFLLTLTFINCRPLSEGKVLKQKFDDIFAATRFVPTAFCGMLFP